MKKKILFLSETVTMAHLIRPLRIASSLSLKDYEIHFASTRVPEFLKKQLSKYHFHLINNGVSEKDFLSAIANGKHPYTEEVLKSYVEEDLRLLNSIKPDLVIGDMRLTLAISAKLKNIPYMNVTNSTWDSSAELPNLVPEIPVVKMFGVKISEMVYSLIKNQIMSQLAAPFNETAKSYGVPSYGSYYDVLTSGDYTVYTDLKNLVNIKEPKSTKLTIGALVYSMDSSNFPALGLPKQNKPRVVISLGSSGPSHQLQDMIDSLSQLDVELVVATGGKRVKAPKDSSIIIKDYLPLDVVLADADLLIFNGGSGSGYLGLSHGVPLLCIPANIDQHQFSYAMVQKGVARSIRSDKFSTGTLNKLVLEMISSQEIKLAAQAVSLEMKNENPLGEIVRLIEAILEPTVMTEAIIEKMVTAALQTPSGDNSQPWKFQWTGEKLFVTHDEERAAHSLNRVNHASMLALGALLEAVKIAASEFGFSTSNKLNFKNMSSDFPCAEIQFHQTSEKFDLLTLQIPKRSTDRRTFKAGSISAPVFTELAEMATSFSKAKLHIQGKPESKLVQYFMDSENFLWTNSKIVQDLVKWMRLSKREVDSSSDGMSWKNMCINFMDAFFLRVLRRLPKSLMFFWYSGLKLKIRMVTKKNLESSAGLICISIKKIDSESICEAGRLAYRAWLMLNAKGYGVQPLTYASTSIADLLSNSLPLNTKSSEKNHFIKGFNLISDFFSLAVDEVPLWIFRTGETEEMPQEMRTPRRQAKEVLISYQRSNKRIPVKNIVPTDLVASRVVNISSNGIGIVSQQEIVLVPEPQNLHFQIKSGEIIELQVRQVWQRSLVTPDERVCYLSGYEILNPPEEWNTLIAKYSSVDNLKVSEI